LGAGIVLSLAFIIHWIISLYRCRRHSNNIGNRRQRKLTHSGAEEANQDWIFLDRNSLEMPITKRQTPPLIPINESILHITQNPIMTTIQRQQQQQQQRENTELSHAQMIAYFDNLKESHA